MEQLAAKLAFVHCALVVSAVLPLYLIHDAGMPAWSAGAVLLILRSQGYSLMWPQEVGVHPYEAGFEDQVVRVDWQPQAQRPGLTLRQ